MEYPSKECWDLAFNQLLGAQTIDKFHREPTLFNPILDIEEIRCYEVDQGPRKRKVTNGFYMLPKKEDDRRFHQNYDQCDTPRYEGRMDSPIPNSGGGFSPGSIEKGDTQRMVARTGMIDLGSQGGKFTWFQKTKATNGGCELKRARLDRVFASIKWKMLYPNAITHVLSAATSDHRPILLDTNGGINCNKSNFKYELMWGRDAKCYWVVKNAWKDKLHQHPIINFYRKLKNTKEHLARWNKVQFKENRVWDVDLVKKWFNWNDAKAILNIQLPVVDTMDAWMWMGEPSGLFSIRSVCRIVMGVITTAPANAKWKLIWTSKIHPRLKLVWWQLERDVFPTRGKIAKFMDLTDVCCPVCGEEEETIFHLLWKCNLAKAIWFNTPMGLRAELVDVNSWEQWKDWFMADFNRPPNLTFQEMLITALCVVETMWFERNSTVHVETRSPAQKVLLNVNNKIRDHLKVAANDVVEFCEWHPPPESWLCCNCDISFDEGGVVLATVVRDGKGNIVTIKTERSLTTDPLIGEGLAVCMAAELMLEMRVKQVIFQSDNMVVATNLSTELGKDIHFKLTNISKRFHQLCLQFTSWGIGHLNRKCNYMAHNVAKWAKETRTIGLTKSTDVDPTVLTDYLDWRKHAG
ncbi:hypothetical protein F8388_000662 [Cannabis sativa]|uniref:RNase H type-1 domain-containing protein n=1 Tax=Cannabis sativa TaxID=3483 RepID=A0A7J6DQM6_CANSA|nr:hypothetical protein G4B88_013264 [Cannabis sativa]KAF4392535.1 hypothetical protein F8388_000662 [Cannabis sativa]